MRKNKFDLSHEKKLSFNMGDLVPILVKEVIPGDSFRITPEIMGRIAPLLAPIYHRLRLKWEAFYVPERLIWDDSQKFHTGGKDGDLKPLRPTFNYPDGPDGSFKTGSLADYMGLPSYDGMQSEITNSIQVTTLPFRAYALIYNEFYRDQNLMDEIVISKASGSGTDDTASLSYNNITKLRKRCWGKDYYTTCQPRAQRGNPVAIPGKPQYVSGALAKNTDGSPSTGAADTIGVDSLGQVIQVTANKQIQLDTSIATLVSDIRTGTRLQVFLEKLQRGGARYIEYLKNVWNEISSDKTLQRPQLIGAGSQPYVISEVLSTYTNNTDQIPQGNMSGHGITVGTGGFGHRFEEHGFLIMIMTVLPDTGYQQGVDRMWTRQDRFDYAIPDFAHIGEQEVYTNELYFDGKEVAPTNPVFGYQGRYNEYKYAQSTTHGDFRTNMAYWHENRIFATKPVLNASFVESDPSTRIFAVTDPTVLHLYANIHFNFSALRALPYLGIPGL
ncbi:MAG: major capsid protein [Microvirus sp.]|nr:MAG: major capsid protein [Microvirus sp.]